jgi:hypothetical protein
MFKSVRTLYVFLQLMASCLPAFYWSFAYGDYFTLCEAALAERQCFTNIHRLRYSGDFNSPRRLNFPNDIRLKAVVINDVTYLLQGIITPVVCVVTKDRHTNTVQIQYHTASRNVQILGGRDITLDNGMYRSTALLTQSGSCNNIQKSGARFAEHSVF